MPMKLARQQRFAALAVPVDDQHAVHHAFFRIGDRLTLPIGRVVRVDGVLSL